MKIETSFLENWIIKYEKVPYNLGESGIGNYQSVGDLARITDSLEELLQVSLGYNDAYGSLELRKAIASFYEGVDPDEILVTYGTSEAIYLYFYLRYQPGANVVVPVPAYFTLYETPMYLGYEVRYLQLRPENNFRLNLNELAKLVDDQTRVIILNTPHNPTGVVYSSEEIQGVLGLAQKHKAEILADEHYRFIPHFNDLDILPSMYGSSPNVVALGSPGKCFAFGGLRIGWLVGSKDLINACRAFKSYTTYTVSSVVDFLAKTALLNWKKIVPQYREWVLKNLEQFQEFVDRHNDFIGWQKPESGIVAFPFFKEKSINSQLFAQKLVEETGVLIIPGEAFDLPGFFRIGMGVKPELFEEAMQKFSNFIDNYQSAK